MASTQDIVIFLPDQHAAEDAGEAEERGAVAALERVAGERQYDLLLPKTYVPLWKDLGVVRAGGVGDRMQHAWWAAWTMC